MNNASTILSPRSLLKRTIAATADTPPIFLRSALAEKASLSEAQMKAAGAVARISTLPLRSGVSMLIGAGGNILAFPGADGILAVDSGFVTSGPQIARALSALSADPLRHLINTHCHFDHTGGNEWMHREGAVIVAHERTRVRMSSRQGIPAFDAIVPRSPVGALPAIVFAHSRNVEVNGELIQLQRYTPAHTDTDISVFFSRANVLHTGDTWFNGFYPFIDYDGGGSISGLLSASSENLALADSRTIVVPGHGAAGNREDLIDFHEMLLAVRENVAALKRSGHPLEAVIAAKPTLPFDEKWAGGFISPDLFASLVYRGV